MSSKFLTCKLDTIIISHMVVRRIIWDYVDKMLSTLPNTWKSLLSDCHLLLSQLLCTYATIMLHPNTYIFIKLWILPFRKPSKIYSRIDLHFLVEAKIVYREILQCFSAKRENRIFILGNMLTFPPHNPYTQLTKKSLTNILKCPSFSSNLHINSGQGFVCLLLFVLFCFPWKKILTHY